MNEEYDLKKELRGIIKEDANERGITQYRTSIGKYLDLHMGDMSTPKLEMILEGVTSNRFVTITKNDQMMIKKLKYVIGQRYDLNKYHAEMANIWDPKTHQNMDVDVYTSEGPVNHFHLVAPDKFFVEGTPSDTCISISKGEYFHHGPHQGILNSSGKKTLIKYLKERSISDMGMGITNWEMIALMWNQMNMDQPQISSDTEMPDYTKLKI